MLRQHRILMRSNIRKFSDYIRVVEVGPRDGLQNEASFVPTATKIKFINQLSETGLKTIEATSFVSSKWVPQMADNVDVFKSINMKPEVSYPVLVPNIQGLEKAIDCNVKEIAIFGAASEAFSRKNINCSIADSVNRFSLVVQTARQHNIKVRAYVSCIVGCPYEGDIKPVTVAKLASSLLELGCYEISLGDTIGVATPRKIKDVLHEMSNVSTNSLTEFALHCHDTYGQALANVHAGLECGVRIFDSSVAGLGGCPYANGASGNLATEELLYFLHGQGLKSGVDLNKVVDVGQYISTALGRENRSKVGVALISKRQR